MMQKKRVMTLLLSMILGASYLVAECHEMVIYEPMSYSLEEHSNKLEFLKSKIQIDEMREIEVGVSLSGIAYDEPLQAIEIEKKIEEMNSALEESARLAQSPETHYTFSLKNQKDIHQNSYYNLTLIGKDLDITYIDQLRNTGYDKLKTWHIASKETIYFKGWLSGALSQEETKEMKDKLFETLEVKATNQYQDDLVETTCAYYGYTPYINDYITEADGQKSNVQVGFKYDELQNQTELIVAFPFYNQPF